jgi:hypothetical protein
MKLTKLYRTSTNKSIGFRVSSLIVVSPVNADNNVDQSLEKWSEKCDKAADKDSQDAAVKANRQYDNHAPEGPLVQCTG